MNTDSPDMHSASDEELTKPLIEFDSARVQIVTLIISELFRRGRSDVILDRHGDIRPILWGLLGIKPEDVQSTTKLPPDIFLDDMTINPAYLNSDGSINTEAISSHLPSD